MLWDKNSFTVFGHWVMVHWELWLLYFWNLNTQMWNWMYSTTSRSEYSLQIVFASMHEEIIPRRFCVHKCFLKKETYIYTTEQSRSKFYPNLRWLAFNLMQSIVSLFHVAWSVTLKQLKDCSVLSSFTEGHQ